MKLTVLQLLSMFLTQQFYFYWQFPSFHNRKNKSRFTGSTGVNHCDPLVLQRYRFASVK